METKIINDLAKTLNVPAKRVETVLTLLEDNTVPFIARYRKEMTGGLDEEAIREIEKVYDYKKQLAERKEDVIRLIEEKEMMTDDLRAAILQAEKLVEVEDLYRPYKEKKKTKATEAIRKGLEPLADYLMSFPADGDPETIAKEYVNEEVDTVTDALEGAKHIVAERVSDVPEHRKRIRMDTEKTGVVITKKRKNEDDPKRIYETYYDYKEPVQAIKLFRVLAINRAEKEKVLSVKIDLDEARVLHYLKRETITRHQSPTTAYVLDAIHDAYKRLIRPAIEREIRSDLSERAEERAIHVFSENLRKLLLQPPIKGKNVLGIDPAFRTGCKLATVDAMGTLGDVGVIYPHPQRPGGTVPEETLEKEAKKLLAIIDKHAIDIIAIGNGTASRETEAFVVDVLKRVERDVYYVIVNESGASVYSASELAKREFPTLDVESRSAVSIARRLQDPLSELVKIDPKAIGVGQYQHDVTQSKLASQLDFVVETVVNQVGVNVNTASIPLLSYVAGVSGKIAGEIVKHRESKGAITTRKELLKIAGLGPKTFEQAAGFLRILDGDNPLDKTAIHPESYDLARAILKDLRLEASAIGTEKIRSLIAPLKAAEIAEKLDAGEPTVQDILDALAAPLRDPRDDIEAPILKSDVLTLEDLRPGMELQGTVRNVVDFGVFVDCGVKEDGLVHISELSDRYVKHPLDVVGVGDIVKVRVKAVDLERGRLQLSMRKPRSNQ